MAKSVYPGFLRKNSAVRSLGCRGVEKPRLSLLFPVLSEDRMVLESLPDQKSKLSIRPSVRPVPVRQKA